MNAEAELLDFEEPFLGLRRDGSVLVTAGIVMIIFAAIPATFLYDGYRVGSNFCLIWATIQGVLGLVFLGIGSHFEHERGVPGDPGLEHWILSDETTP